jgi:TrmH family RNA methyltransferase
MITSSSNETIKNITKLVKSAKARRKEGVFVIEGDRIAREAPKEIVCACFVTEEYLSSHDVAGLGFDAQPTIVSSAVFSKMSDTQNPQGILCVCRMNTIGVNDLLSERKEGDLRLLILEGVQDPGNLGTMVRSAEGAGFDAIIADENTADVYNPKVVRSTMGSLFRVPVIYTSDLAKAVDDIRNINVTVYAAHLKGEISYRDESYGNRLAFLIGNEGSGLSDDISTRADRLIRIPMHGKLESLNAAVAASLLMFGV